MRARLILLAVAALALAAASVGYLTTRGSAKQASSLPARTVTVGAIEVTIEPVRLDATGAVFRVRLDTHSTDLGMALRGALRVDGIAWRGGDWSGAVPGGHHREGEIRFDAAGAPRGTARLEVTGLERSVVGEWQLAD